MRALEDLGRSQQAQHPALGIDNIVPLEDRLERPLAAPKFYMTMMSAFSSIALAIVVVGVLGLVSYSIARRVPEIALRLALGASPHDVLFRIAGLVLLPMTAGTLAGVLASYWLSSGFRDLLYDVVPLDPATIAVSVLTVSVCGVLACLPSARRAVTVDPATVLRHE
jgi:ABC-type antimicrobial peptide transport system permease subunit